ncbi:MAG: putative Ig domain-containing protein [Draconibacterium sp.]|nr:putative Ig domain-containing protein [Draconibacterium sp.]
MWDSRIVDDVNATGNPAPIYSLTNSPAGMTINATTGLIEWTPGAGGNYNVTVEASNGVNPAATESFVIAVPIPPAIPAGLVAYWKLDEATGNTYVDFTGTNNGTGNPSRSR